MTWDEFISIPNVTRVFNYGADQCVALANLYHEQVLGGTLKGTYIQSAYQWWTDFSKYPQFTEVYDQVDVNAPAVAGDIFVTRPSSQYDPVHGHIGVVIQPWNGKTFGTIEQNANMNRYVYKTYNRTRSNIYGYLRPKANPGDEMTPDQNNALMSVYKATFFGGGDAGDKSILQRLVDIEEKVNKGGGSTGGGLTEADVIRILKSLSYKAE